MIKFEDIYDELSGYYSDLSKDDYEHYNDEFGGRYSNDKKILVKLDLGKQDIDTYSILEGTEIISDNCITGPQKVKTLIIPKSVRKVIPGMNLGFIENIENHSEEIICLDGLIMDKTGKTILSHYGFNKCFKIPEGVECVSDSAFFRSSAETIILPESVFKIKSLAFAFSHKLKNINLRHVKYIGENAFLSTLIDINNLTWMPLYQCESCGYTIRCDKSGLVPLITGNAFTLKCNYCKNILFLSAHHMRNFWGVCPNCDQTTLSTWNPVNGSCPKCNGVLKEISNQEVSPEIEYGKEQYQNILQRIDKVLETIHLYYPSIEIENNSDSNSITVDCIKKLTHGIYFGKTTSLEDDKIHLKLPDESLFASMDFSGYFDKDLPASKFGSKYWIGCVKGTRRIDAIFLQSNKINLRSLMNMIRDYEEFRALPHDPYKFLKHLPF